MRKANRCEPTCVSTLPWSSGRVSGKGSLCMKMCSVCAGECIFWMLSIFCASVIHCVNRNSRLAFRASLDVRKRTSVRVRITWILAGFGLREADGWGVARLVDHTDVYLVFVGVQSSKQAQDTNSLTSVKELQRQCTIWNFT